jgi:hypothetical protein
MIRSGIWPLSWYSTRGRARKPQARLVLTPLEERAVPSRGSDGRHGDSSGSSGPSAVVAEAPVFLPNGEELKSGVSNRGYPLPPGKATELVNVTDQGPRPQPVLPPIFVGIPFASRSGPG